MTTVQIARRLKAAVDLIVVGAGAPNTHETRESVLDALTDVEDPEYRSGDISRVLDLLPPAGFPLEQAPPIPTDPGQI